jgi:hypothetical protein
MKKFILMAAAAGVLLTLPALAPQANADSITVGPNGVTVRDHDHDRDHWRERRHWRRHHAECRVVKERHRRHDGTVVIRKTRTC